MQTKTFYIYYTHSEANVLISDCLYPMMADLQKSAQISSWCFWIDRFRGQYIGLSCRSELLASPAGDKIISEITSFLQKHPSPMAVPDYDEGLFMHFTSNQLVVINYQYTDEEIAEKISCITCNTAPLVPLIAESYSYMDRFTFELSLEFAIERTHLLLSVISNVCKRSCTQVAHDLLLLYFKHFKFDTNGYLFFKYRNEADAAYAAISTSLQSIVSGNYLDKTHATDWEVAVSHILHSLKNDHIVLGLDVFRIILMGYGQNIISGFNILYWIHSIYSQPIHQSLSPSKKCNYLLN